MEYAGDAIRDGFHPKDLTLVSMPTKSRKLPPAASLVPSPNECSTTTKVYIENKLDPERFKRPFYRSFASGFSEPQ